MSAETNPIVAGDAAVDALPSSLPSESLPVEGIIREETIDAVVENVVDDTPDDAPAAQPHHEAVPTQSMPFTETPLHDPFSFAQIRPIPGLLSIPVVSDFSNQPEFLSMEPLTRTTIPVLNDDPYPASLSTPFDDIEDDGSPGDEADDDGDESNSSLESLTMNHEVLSVEAVGDGSQGVVNDEDFWELDLAYPEDTVAPLLDTAHTVPAEDDADGDMDPDFLSTIGGTLTSTLSRDADADKISPKHVEHQETVVSTSLSSAALTDSEPCPSTPLQSEENTIGVNNVEDMKMEPPLEMAPQTSELPGTGDLVRAIEVSETNGVQNADTKTEPETTQTSEIYSVDGAETLEHQPAAPMIDAEKSLIGRVSEHTTEENIQPHEAIHNNNGTVTVDAERY
ncbi:hypothetical protein BDP27DRAFT_494692 [Rhodocollybia butyracea]|uniref:Uncharacterized protein n=1 Tax=Rhodocollybia butyracea TaxID=206335 RepID=A0A9P5PYL1_9AGAR|nr:hypothetical protein BDP27DRAFT_494692 [Rhodocollybia butyracea]